MIRMINKIYAPLVAAAFKCGVQKSIRDGKGEAGAGDALAKAEHIGVIVLAGGAGLKFAGAQRGSDAGNPVGRDGHADARAADQNSQIAAIPLLQHRVAQSPGVDRGIATVRRVRAVIFQYPREARRSISADLSANPAWSEAI